MPFAPALGPGEHPERLAGPGLARLQQDLQLAGSHLVLSLLAFNVGVELGQLAVLLATVPVLAVVLQRPKARRAGIVILSALIAHIAWHWVVERMEALLFVRWPPLDVAAFRMAARRARAAGFALLRAVAQPKRDAAGGAGAAFGAALTPARERTRRTARATAGARPPAGPGTSEPAVTAGDTTLNRN